MRIDSIHATPPANLIDLFRHERVDTSRAGVDLMPRQDRVEISERSRWMERLQSLPSVRTELVNRFREQIIAGTYDTEGKLDAAINRLADELPLEELPKRST